MRTTIELPDELLTEARLSAARAGVSMKLFFIQAIRHELAAERRKTRHAPPAIGDPRARPIGILTPEQIDEAMFG